MVPFFDSPLAPAPAPAPVPALVPRPPVVLVGLFFSFLIAVACVLTAFNIPVPDLPAATVPELEALEAGFFFGATSGCLVLVPAFTLGVTAERVAGAAPEVDLTLGLDKSTALGAGLAALLVFLGSAVDLVTPGGGPEELAVALGMALGVDLGVGLMLGPVLFPEELSMGL